MDQIFGLPAHPLLIHFPVVSIPALCMAAVAMAVWPKARRMLGIPAVLVGGASLVTTFLATQSGDALTERLVADFFLSEDQISKHKELGQTTLVLVTLLFVFLCAQFAVGRSIDTKTANSANVPAAAKPGLMVLGVVVALFAVLSTVWVVRTGHEGAKVVWGSLADSDDEGALVEVVPTDDDGDAAAPVAATIAPEPTAPEPTVAPDPTAVPTAEPEPTPEPEPTQETEPEPTPEPEPEPTPEPEPSESDDPIPVESDGGIGDSPGVDALAVYSTACANCHGDDGKGTQRGRPLTRIGDNKTFEEHVVSVADGTGNMPAFAERLSPEEIEAVVTYVRETF